MTKAKFTDSNGKIKEQTLSELIDEAESKEYITEWQIDSYLYDCYLADESGITGNFKDWLDQIEQGW